jgi:hypothetical protein
MEEKEKKEQEPEDRKSFRKPRLRIYGHISDITQASPVGNPPLMDGSHSPGKTAG